MTIYIHYYTFFTTWIAILSLRTSAMRHQLVKNTKKICLELHMYSAASCSRNTHLSADATQFQPPNHFPCPPYAGEPWVFASLLWGINIGRPGECNECMANEIVKCEKILTLFLWKIVHWLHSIWALSNKLKVRENAVHIIHRASKLAWPPLHVFGCTNAFLQERLQLCLLT